MCVTCPGDVTCITPAQIHISFEVLFKAGILASRTVGDPGTQGVVVAGRHGIGVNTPSAAAVAPATIGLARLWHIPNGMMFTIGTWSMIFAAGTLLVITIFFGSTTKLLGAMPKLQVSIAP